MEEAPSFWSIKSVRTKIAFLLAAALCVEGLMRTNLNMAMICMVNRTAIAEIEKHSVFESALPENATDTSNICELRNKTEKKVGYDGDIVWTSSEQAWIFTSFYFGGLFITMPGSYLCDSFGAKLVVQYGFIANIIGSFVTPFVARNIGLYGVIIVRFLMGCGQGVLVPCMSVLTAYWFPSIEKSTAIAVATTGNQLSIILAMFLTAELCQANILGGWPLAFYLYGIIGIVFCTFWHICVRDFPTQHKNLSDAELLYITGSLDGRGQKRPKPEVPWKIILKSPAVWSAAVSSFGQHFVLVGTITYLPLYYRTALSMDLTSNGLLSAMPFIVQLITKAIFVSIASETKKKGLNATLITKVFNSFASFGSAVCFLLLLLGDCNSRLLSVVLICAAMSILSGFIPGFSTSIVVIAPKYTSSIAAFCRLLGTLASFISPYLIGKLIIKGSLSEWRIVFIMMAIIMISTGAVFQIFGSGVQQYWATEDAGKKDETEMLPLSKAED